jgi:hypothetical protein
MTTLSQSIHQWLRHWLGTHGYTRALKDRAKRDQLDEIVGRIERGELDGHEVRAVFAEAARRNLKIDEVFAALAPAERITEVRGPRGIVAVLPVKRSGTGTTERTTQPSPPAYRPAPSAPVARPVPAAVVATAAPATSPAVEAELRALRTELEAGRRHAIELETLVRGLLERAVLDATRIRGLEDVIMAIAKGAGIDAAAEEVYVKSTRDYLAKREDLLRRARAA